MGNHQTYAWAANHLQRRLHQDNVGRLDGDVGAGADGDAHVGRREGGRVVDAVTDEGDLGAGIAQLLHLRMSRQGRRSAANGTRGDQWRSSCTLASFPAGLTPATTRDR